MTSREYVRIEMSKQTLIRLLASGAVCAADLSCLDSTAKQCLMQLMLQSCQARECREHSFTGLLSARRRPYYESIAQAPNHLHQSA
jgi:hypothetical protein